VPDERPLHEVLFDYAVYVPLGMAASLAEQLPELTERGRRLAAPRIHLARLMGEFAVGHAQRRVSRIFSSDGRSGAGTEQQAESATPGPPSRHGPESVNDGGLGAEASPPLASASAVVPRTEEPLATSSTTSAAVRRLRRTTSPRADDATGGDSPAVASVVMPPAESLPIPAYDTLAASQVVQRLSSLEPDELEAVGRYEIGTRGRRTILNRIAQLNAAAGRAPL
jgi:hypothetical protein